MELRCPGGRKSGELDGDLISVKCDRPWCGAETGVVVIHHFSTIDGSLVRTDRYRDPAKAAERR